jgi:nitroreductase
MEFEKVLKKRRSVRSFSEKDIDPVKIEYLIKAAFWAPSFMGNKALHIFIIDDKETLTKMAETTSYSSVLKAAKRAFILGYDTSSGSYPIEETSMAATNIMLAAEDIGLSSCFVQFRGEEGPYGKPENFIKKILHIPENIMVLSGIAIGYPVQNNIQLHTESEIIRKNIHYNLYGIH